MEPIVGWLTRRIDCGVVLVMGYTLLLTATVWAQTASGLDQFLIIMGLLGQVGASTIAFVSLIVLWEWFTPRSRGVVTGLGTGILLGLAGSAMLAQQMIVNPAFFTNTSLPFDQQMEQNIKYMFLAVFALQALGLIMALLTFRSNSIQQERTLAYQREA
jgi:MFS family permease